MYEEGEWGDTFSSGVILITRSRSVSLTWGVGQLPAELPDVEFSVTGRIVTGTTAEPPSATPGESRCTRATWAVTNHYGYCSISTPGAYGVVL